MPDDDLTTLAADAFIYGYPLVYDLGEVARIARHGLGAVPPVPLNTFGHARALAGPDDAFVSINNDTLYSLANVDASGGPVRLEVPDAAGRYYVMQFVDAWTNNFAYVGHRATGTAAAAFLLVPPGWEGDAPADATVIRLPTAIVSIVGRWAVDGEEDVPAVHALQDALTLTPSGPGAGLPAPGEGVSDDLAFWEELRVLMRAFPPAARDRAYQERFAPLGLLDAESPYPMPGPALHGTLADGLEEGRARLEAALQGGGPTVNGWSPAYHAFDYNLDVFEVGALDDPAWKMPDDPARYLRRAAAARAGLWGNHGYEAAYAMVYVDADGEPLDGARRYELRFAQEPPCRAFWSVTMYDAQEFHLVRNPIDRYSIGDRTRGLHRGDDGSLTIVMGHEEPDTPEGRANWLPAPAGRFRPILRMYEPDDAVTGGGYELPPVVRVG
ncbi:MAG TPA: DUF1254 domain-containing protein [Miltoncostaea sp.]|nr:DUF1254 domain-containing protein [Miltoncostaea sp.]